MKHVEHMWIERVVRRVSSTKNLSMTHVLVVITDLLTDLDVMDLDALDYLEGELRRENAEVDEIRFIPPGRSIVKSPPLTVQGAAIAAFDPHAVLFV